MENLNFHKHKYFKDAAKSNTVNKNLLNRDSLDAKLSITDIPDTEVLFSKEGPLELRQGDRRNDIRRTKGNTS